ncbi:MAG: hypothetical protein JO272_00895 [Pseudonocardiales bacterium]|nr:hypothetical protein [Pseudonocardiales bacterium]
MSDALSPAELTGHQVELLPARTVLSLFAQDIGSGILSGGSPLDSFTKMLGLGAQGADGHNGAANGPTGSSSS